MPLEKIVEFDNLIIVFYDFFFFFQMFTLNDFGFGLYDVNRRTDRLLRISPGSASRSYENNRRTTKSINTIVTDWFAGACNVRLHENIIFEFSTYLATGTNFPSYFTATAHVRRTRRVGQTASWLIIAATATAVSLYRTGPFFFFWIFNLIFLLHTFSYL